MCSKDLGADFVFCWPSTELAVMGAEGAAPIIFRRELEKAGNQEEALQGKIRQYREEFANPYLAAEHLHIDDVIDPAETRPKLIAALEMVINKQEDKPAKKTRHQPDLVQRLQKKYHSVINLKGKIFAVHTIGRR